MIKIRTKMTPGVSTRAVKMDLLAAGLQTRVPLEKLPLPPTTTFLGSAYLVDWKTSSLCLFLHVY